MEINPILEALRVRILQGNSAAEENWSQELEQLYKCGLGLDKVLQYLYFERPSAIAFQNWINSKSAQLQSTTVGLEEVFSAEDLAFFATNGYIVLPQAISEEDSKATQQIIWDFLGMQPDNPESWYTVHPEQRGLMVNFFEHEILEKNRASAKIRKAYEQLYQSTSIYKTIDKVSFNPPIRPGYSFMGSDLHWDVSLQQPIPFRLQGLLYLSDCGPQDGAFHCVPGFHNQIGDWLQEIPKGVDIRKYAQETLKPIAITGKAGDMVIWNQALPHCATPNYGIAPRMVQYLTYFSENYIEPTVWI